MDENILIKQENTQVVQIETFEQDVIVQKQRETVEISPSFLRIQDINITKSWDVLNIDKTNVTYYYIQYKLDGEDEYKIQRIHKLTYEIKYHLSTTDEWENRTTITYG